CPPVFLRPLVPWSAPSLVVDVVGAVRRAGLQHVPRGSRVADVIARAGGATRRADLAQVNLAAPVSDGQQVVVPKRGSAAPMSPRSGAPPEAPRCPDSRPEATWRALRRLPSQR